MLLTLSAIGDDHQGGEGSNIFWCEWSQKGQSVPISGVLVIG
jgi:hypothetical protein